MASNLWTGVRRRAATTVVPAIIFGSRWKIFSTILAAKRSANELPVPLPVSATPGKTATRMAPCHFDTQTRLTCCARSPNVGTWPEAAQVTTRLVGSDLRAWHRSWTDYGVLGTYRQRDS